MRKRQRKGPSRSWRKEDKKKKIGKDTKIEGEKIYKIVVTRARNLNEKRWTWVRGPLVEVQTPKFKVPVLLPRVFVRRWYLREDLRVDGDRLDEGGFYGNWDKEDDRTGPVKDEGCLKSSFRVCEEVSEKVSRVGEIILTNKLIKGFISYLMMSIPWSELLLTHSWFYRGLWGRSWTVDEKRCKYHVIDVRETWVVIGE